MADRSDTQIWNEGSTLKWRVFTQGFQLPGKPLRKVRTYSTNIGVLTIVALYIGNKRWRFEASWSKDTADIYGDYIKARETATRRIMEQATKIARQIGWCEPLDKSTTDIHPTTRAQTGS